MTWRGTSTVRDRIFSALPYLIPLIDVLVFGFATPILSQVPALGIILVPLAPLIAIYRGIPFLSLIVFFALFILVIRNENIAHFIRFNAMQAILLDIVLILCSVVNQFLIAPTLGAVGSSATLIIEVLYNVVFFGTVAAVGYSLVQIIRGAYPDKIPSLSEIVYMQVR